MSVPQPRSTLPSPFSSATSINTHEPLPPAGEKANTSYLASSAGKPTRAQPALDSSRNKRSTTSPHARRSSTDGTTKLTWPASNHSRGGACASIQSTKERNDGCEAQLIIRSASGTACSPVGKRAADSDDAAKLTLDTKDSDNACDAALDSALQPTPMSATANTGNPTQPEPSKHPSPIARVSSETLLYSRASSKVNTSRAASLGAPRRSRTPPPAAPREPPTPKRAPAVQTVQRSLPS